MSAGLILINGFKNVIVEKLVKNESVTYNEDQPESYKGDAYVVALWELEGAGFISHVTETVGVSPIRTYGLTLKGWAMYEKAHLEKK